MDFFTQIILNLQNVTVFSYSSELRLYYFPKLQLFNDGINFVQIANEYTSTIHQRDRFQRLFESLFCYPYTLENSPKWGL
jgi:hypothetical protein